MQYLLCETLAFILLDLWLIQIISEGQLGNLAEVCMAGAHTVMGQVLYLPAHASTQKQFHACSHMWVTPLWVPVPGSQSVILVLSDTHSSQDENEKL